MMFKKLFISLIFVSLVIYSSAQLINGSIIITEINYNNDSTISSGDWFEVYNTASSSVNMSNWILRDENILNQFVVPQGTVLGGNQYLVFVDDTVKFHSRFPNVNNIIGEFQFGLSNKADKIRIYNEDIDLQYSVTYLDSAKWPKGADGEGRTLELVSPSSNPLLNTSWFDGCVGGSPGGPYIPCNPDLVFSELNYNSDTLYDCNDWVELWNRSNTPINLSGWELKDGKDTNIYVIPTLIIPANSYLVFCNNVLKFDSFHPNITNKLGDIGFSFSNVGESVRLYDATGKLHFSWVYNDTVPFPITPDGGGYTLELLDPSGKMNSGANWFAGCFLGSPGKAYNPDCTNSISSISETSTSILINNNRLIINSADYNYTVRLYDCLGRMIESKKDVNSIDLTEYESGLYIVNVQSKNQFFSKIISITR